MVKLEEEKKTTQNIDIDYYVMYRYDCVDLHAVLNMKNFLFKDMKIICVLIKKMKIICVSLFL